MLAPTTLFWEVNEDLCKDYPRCGWSNEQWETLFMESWVKDTKQLWAWASQEQNVQTAKHDNTDNDKIFRYATMTAQFCVKLRSYYLSKGNNLKLTSHELWESLSLARTGTVECKNWKSGSKTKVLSRLCFIIGQWNRVSVNSSINNYINRYLCKYKTTDVTHSLLRNSEPMPQNEYIFKFDTSGFKAKLYTLDQWNDITWQHQQGNACIVSSTALFLSLGLKLGVVRRCPLVSFDNASPKDASVTLYASSTMSAMYSDSEYNGVLRANQSNGISVKMIQEMSAQSIKYVCIFVWYSYYFFSKTFVISKTFLKILYFVLL